MCRRCAAPSVSSPPMAISPSSPSAKVRSTCSTPPSRLNTLVREVRRMVPPRGSIPRVDCRSSGMRSLSSTPCQPPRKPTSSWPWTLIPWRTMARMTALRPGQSPPPVSTPKRIAPSLTPSCGAVPDAPTFDLQSHSSYSDGALPPAEVVAAAAAAGVELLALSDHDTVEGVDEALAAGREHDVAILPAAELSSIDGLYDDLHVLGYGIDHHDEALLRALDEFRADREARAGRMAAALADVGFALDSDLLPA